MRRFAAKTQRYQLSKARRYVIGKRRQVGGRDR